MRTCLHPVPRWNSSPAVLIPVHFGQLWWETCRTDSLAEGRKLHLSCLHLFIIIYLVLKQRFRSNHPWANHKMYPERRNERLYGLAVAVQSCVSSQLACSCVWNTTLYSGWAPSAAAGLPGAEQQPASFQAWFSFAECCFLQTVPHPLHPGASERLSSILCWPTGEHRCCLSLVLTSAASSGLSPLWIPKTELPWHPWGLGLH